MNAFQKTSVSEIVLQDSVFMLVDEPPSTRKALCLSVNKYMRDTRSLFGESSLLCRKWLIVASSSNLKMSGLGLTYYFIKEK